MDATDVRSEIGIRMDKSFALADRILTQRGRVVMTIPAARLQRPSSGCPAQALSSTARPATSMPG